MEGRLVRWRSARAECARKIFAGPDRGARAGARRGVRRLRPAGRSTRPACWAAGLARVTGFWLLRGADCGPAVPLPTPGLPDWRALGTLAVRDGQVDLAAGNLLLRRTDLSIETRLGTQAVTQVYNSASDRWSWSFEMRYAGGLFEDDNGAVYLVGADPGPIPGTPWRVVDAATLETRGGLRFFFASDGRLARVAWRNASYPRLELQRPGDGTLHVVQCTAPGACADVFVVHYAGAQVTRIVDRAGRESLYAYAGGRLARVETAFTRENGLPPFRYDYQLRPDGRPAQITVTNPEQERSRYELDPQGRLLAWTQLGEESPRWSFLYQGDPRRTIATDPLGRTVELRFDGRQRLLELRRHGVGEVTHFEWTGYRVTRTVHPDGSIQTARWEDDELVELWLPTGRHVQLEYVAGARNVRDPWRALPRRVREAGALVVERSFDALGRLVSEANGAGERTHFHYGPLDVVERIELPSGLTVRLAEYGEHGQPVEVRMPSSDPEEPDWVERREFDAVGNLTRGTDPGSETGTQMPGVVARAFDAARNVRLVVASMARDGTPQDLVLERRSDGRLRAIRRPYGADVELVYDAIGRLRAQRERVDGAWVETRLAWTPLGELARIERANGMTTELAWDAAGRLVRRTNRRHGALESEVRALYEAGRLVRKEDSLAGTTQLGYDARGRIEHVRWPDGETSRITYDGRDRPIRMRLFGADAVLLRDLGLGYDAAGRETRLSDGGQLVYQEVYGGGRLAEIRYGNGVVRTISYDAFGRPAGAQSRDAAGHVLESETVVRQGRTLAGPDPNGPIRETLARYEADAPFGVVAFTERAIGYRFTDGRRWIADFAPDSGTHQWCTGSCTASRDLHALEYSGLMDLERLRLPLQDPQFQQELRFVKNPERNRLHGIVLRSITTPSPPCSPCTPTVVDEWQHHYEWDEAGFATRRDGVAIEWDATGHLARFGSALFVHDAEGRLRGSLVAGVVQLRRFGGLVESDAAGRPQRIDLGPVVIDVVANRRAYRHLDWRGNVRSVWDDTRALRSVREYEAYGPGRVHGEGADPRGFAQGIEQAGLVLIGDRVYDPLARQFLSPDPVYDLFHQYVYAAGDPANYWDPSGLDARSSPGFAIAGAAGQFFGAAISVGGGALVSAASGNPLPFAAGVALAPHAGAYLRAWFEFVYIVVYDSMTDDEESAESQDTGAGAASGLPLGVIQVYGPGRPHWAGPGERWTGPELRYQGPGGARGTPGGLVMPSFAMGAVGGCGLLGAEALAPLALLALRRRRGRRRIRA